MNMDETRKRDASHEVEEDEALVWSGHPPTGVIFRITDVFLIPFSLIWGGFAIFWESTVLGMMVFRRGEGPPLAIGLAFACFGLPFVAVAFYIMVGRFLYDARVRASTSYAVTDRRVIIVTGIRSREVSSHSLATLTGVTLKELADGTGTIRLGQSAPFSTMYEGLHWPGMGSRLAPTLERIPNARDVFKMITKPVARSHG